MLIGDRASGQAFPTRATRAKRAFMAQANRRQSLGSGVPRLCLGTRGTREKLACNNLSGSEWAFPGKMSKP
jgi:hypothetical protein